MILSAHDLLQLRAALQDAVMRCSERCLYQSAKWAAELLNSIPEPAEEPSPLPSRGPPLLANGAAVFAANPDPEEAALEAREASKYLLAKSLFDCREYDRCTAVFLPDSILAGMGVGAPPPPNTGIDPPAASSPATTTGRDKDKGKNRGDPARSKEKAKRSRFPDDNQGNEVGKEPFPAGDTSDRGESNGPVLSQRSLFLALYAKYLSGEKRRIEETEMVMGPQDQGHVLNQQLVVVGRWLDRWFEQRTSPDGETVGSQGWLEYLYGIVLAKQNNDAKAMDFLIRSVHLFPMNWGSWLEMTSLMSRVEELNRVSRRLPQNIVSFIFHLHASLELYQHGPNLANSLDQLLTIFPTSSFLLTCNALLAYHAKDLIGAEQHFARLLALHPRRLDSLDHYSNILYVMNLRPKLAFLAHLCSSVDRFRPEACVVVGNYYSLLSQHEKAVQYFRRALTLDRSCLSAWTLMGHEYVELKNTHAAIESYRRAVDVNRRDYRAWYGLGQTYEMLEMHTYSLWYYKKAAGLRPWDGKMWQAVGSCLERLGRDLDGIKALKRALLADAYYEAGSSFGSAGDQSGGTEGAGRATMGFGLGHMDPEVLLQIALMYERLGQEAEAKSYMELCVSQEDGGAVLNPAESIHILNDSPAESDDSLDGPGGATTTHAAGQEAIGGGGGGGTGVTEATSAARRWLAKYALQKGDLLVAHRLATDLCQDGVELEDAKALMREVRSHMEAAGVTAPLG